MSVIEEALPDFDRLWDYDDPAATEARFLTLLSEAASRGDASYHLQLLTQIARAQGLQDRFETAHQTLDEVEKLLLPDLHRARVRYLLERGRVFNSSGDPERACPLFLEAWGTACAIGEDAYAVDAAHMLAIAEPIERRESWNLRALEFAARSADPRARAWRGSLLNNLGWTYHDQGDYPKALHCFAEAVETRIEQGDPEKIRIARWAVARTLRSLGRVEEALTLQRELHQLLKSQGRSSPYIDEEIAECLRLLGRTETLPC